MEDKSVLITSLNWSNAYDWATFSFSSASRLSVPLWQKTGEGDFSLYSLCHDHAKNLLNTSLKGKKMRNEVLGIENNRFYFMRRFRISIPLKPYPAISLGETRAQAK